MTGMARPSGARAGVHSLARSLCGVTLAMSACSAEIRQEEELVRPGGPEQVRVADLRATQRPPAPLGHRAAMAEVDDDAVVAAEQPVDPTSYPPNKPLTISARMSQRCRAVRATVERAAVSAGLDPNLLLAIAWVESGFNAGAQSPAGALGVMQMVPRTAAAFGCDDASDTRSSTVAAAAYVVRLMRQFDGDMVYALCAYHSGSVLARRSLRAGVLPPNLAYAERVFEARARLERYGCDGRESD